MKSRYYAVGVLAVAALGVMGVYHGRSTGHVAERATSVGAAEVQSRGDGIVAATGEVGTATPHDLSAYRALTPLGAIAAGPEAEPEVETPKVDPEKVRAALARFEKVAGGITKEQIEAEQVKMKKAKEEMMAIKTEDATAEPFVDSTGQKWTKLSFPSGEVRYEFPN